MFFEQLYHRYSTVSSYAVIQQPYCSFSTTVLRLLNNLSAVIQQPVAIIQQLCHSYSIYIIHVMSFFRCTVFLSFNSSRVLFLMYSKCPYHFVISNDDLFAKVHYTFCINLLWGMNFLSFGKVTLSCHRHLFPFFFGVWWCLIAWKTKNLTAFLTFCESLQMRFQCDKLYRWLDR